LLLYIIICCFYVKISLTAESKELNLDQTEKSYLSKIIGLEQFYQCYCEFAKQKIIIKPKRLNKIYNSLLKSYFQPKLLPNYNALVDEILDISHPYNQEKSKSCSKLSEDNQAFAAKVRSELGMSLV